MNLIPPLWTEPARGEQRLLLHAVDWQTYEKFLEAVGKRPLRLTYDRGNLEIMAPSWNHEWWKRRFGFLMPILGAETSTAVQGGGATTYQREDLERGLEPDECFYLGQHAVQMRGPREIDLRRDPPPDLAIEIDISSSSLNRLSIYAALGVPELWRFDGAFLHAYRLAANGVYELCEHSLGFPFLPLGEFVQFLQKTQELEESALIRPFQAWIRAHIPPAQPGIADGSQPSS
jgi:Uma2 family endonuclease